MSKAAQLLNIVEENWVIDAIREAEKHTTGEIKVHIENYCYCEVKNRAAELFAELHMHETHFRNGVLVYIAAKDRHFAVLGDIKINEQTNEGYWLQQTQLLAQYFKQREYYEGIAKVIKNVGNVLNTHFPAQANNPNELPDNVSYG